MTLALPSGPQPTAKRQAFIATAVASAGLVALIGGMLGMWLKFRAAAPTRTSSDGLYTIKDWLPEAIKIPEVAANTMLVGLIAGCVMAQWAVYSAKRADARHRSAALGVCLVLEVATLNAQLAVYNQMGIGVADGTYQSMFFAITGVIVLVLASAIGFTSVALFRSLGGRNDDNSVVSAHALYWYVLTAAFTAVWFVVYVQK